MKTKIRTTTILILCVLNIFATQSYAWYNTLPVAVLTAEPNYAVVGESVTLDGSSSYDTGGYIVKYEWDWTSDGTYDYNETWTYYLDGAFDGITTHEYNEPNTYTVTLRVTDNESGTDTDTCTVTVGKVLNVTQSTTYSTIQSALDDASNDDTIKVGLGTYEECIDFDGVACTLTSIDPNDQDVVEATIIDADDYWDVVDFISGEGSDSVLSGFTLINGYCGIYCEGTSPTINNCIISDNGTGGWEGMYNYDSSSPTVNSCIFYNNPAGAMKNESSSSPTVSGCIFHDNTEGGMVNEDNSSPNVTDCVFYQNSASYGGGMRNEDSSSPNVTNCVFSNNHASHYGGGMYNYTNSSPNVINCVFWENSTDYIYAPDCGGGGMCNSSSSPTITNCTFSGNFGNAGGGMYLYNCDSNVTNCIFWDNTYNNFYIPYGSGSEIYLGSGNPTFSYCDIKGGINGDGDEWGGSDAIDGGGNIDIDPNFLGAHNPEGPDGLWMTCDDGLNIMPYSPCVDDANAYEAPSTDITGLARVDVPYTDNNGAGSPNYVDIGAYESHTIWFVDDDANSNDDGSSWDDAFDTLQEALAVAADGNEIWVAMGTYKPDTTAPYNRSTSFVMVAGVDMYGGFTGEMNEPRQRDWTGYNQTILSGDINVPGDANDNSYCVVKSNFLTTGAYDEILDGFTITGGNGTSGGGIYCLMTAPTIRNCVITNNKASGDGGGMYNLASSPTVVNCTFSGNEASSGGGMYSVNQGSRVVTNCVFVANKASNGGGLYNNCQHLTVTNCTFSKNEATSNGGGLYAEYSYATPTIVNNCIFWGNTAAGQGDEIYNEIYYKAFIRYSDVNGCGGSGAGWDPNFGVDWGGNIDSDPCFVDIDDPDGNDGVFGTFDDGLRLDYHPNSPCIDAADGSAASSADMRGFRRQDINDVNNTGTGEPNYIDMGAYERCPLLVHFTDGALADRYVGNFLRPFTDTYASDILGIDNYPSTSAAIPNTLDDSGKYGTLDCIAIYPGVKVTIYPNAGYSGTPFLEKTGPAVIYNAYWEGMSDDHLLTEQWIEPFQSEFPQSTRSWSDSDMTNGTTNYWTGGSMKIEEQ